MSKLHRRRGIEGICVIGALMLAACGEIREGTGDNISAEALEDNVQFEISVEEPYGRGTQERIGEIPQEIHLLVAIDNSGSMGPSGRVIHDTIKMISVLVEKELPMSDVEYMLFNVDGAKFLPRDDLFPITYSGQTSIYKGMEQIDAWLVEHVQSDKEQGIRTALILFSDMYSSRSAKGDYYDKDIAREEQDKISDWVENWNAWAEDGDVDICVIQWESMAAGESSSRTLDQELNSYVEGFQVQLSPLENYLLDLGDVKLDKASQNIQIEQKVVGDCLEKVIEVMTGVTGQTWKDMREISKWRKQITLPVKTGEKLIIRIDSASPGSNTVMFSDSTTKQEYFLERIFQGEVTNVYMVEDLPVDKLVISAGDAKEPHVYCLTIPQIEVEAEFVESSGRTAIGDAITINIIAKCKEDDIRWKDTGLPLCVKIEVEDIDQNHNCIVHEESLAANPGDKLIVTPRKAGNFKIIVYCIDSAENKEVMGSTILNVK